MESMPKDFRFVRNTVVWKGRADERVGQAHEAVGQAVCGVARGGGGRLAQHRRVDGAGDGREILRAGEFQLDRGAAVLHAQGAVNHKAHRNAVPGVNAAMHDKAVQLRSQGDGAHQRCDEDVHDAETALGVRAVVGGDIGLQRSAVQRLAEEVDRPCARAHDVGHDLLHGWKGPNAASVAAGKKHGQDFLYHSFYGINCITQK